MKMQARVQIHSDFSALFERRADGKTVRPTGQPCAADGSQALLVVNLQPIVNRPGWNAHLSSGGYQPPRRLTTCPAGQHSRSQTVGQTVLPSAQLEESACGAGQTARPSAPQNLAESEGTGALVVQNLRGDRRN